MAYQRPLSILFFLVAALVVGPATACGASPAHLAVTTVLPVLLPGQVTAQEVRQAIRKAQNFLITEQAPDGSWSGPGAVGSMGVSVLATLALLESELDRDHPRLQAALRYIRTIDPTQATQWRTYITSLHTMALVAAGGHWPRSALDPAERPCSGGCPGPLWSRGRGMGLWHRWAPVGQFEHAVRRAGASRRC